MSRFELTAKPEFPDHSVAVGYERQLRSFFAYVFGPDGDPVVAASGLLTPILDPAVVLHAVKPYAEVPPDLPALLAAMPTVEKTATAWAAERRQATGHPPTVARAFETPPTAGHEAARPSGPRRPEPRSTGAASHGRRN